MVAKHLLYQLVTSLLLVAVILLSPCPVSAEVKEIIAEGTYIMGDSETPTVAQERALIAAKRAAIEQAGTYLESYSEVQNKQLTKDEIRTFASGIIETTVLDKKRSFYNDSIQFWVKVRCIINTDNIQVMYNKVQDKAIMETLRKVQADYEKSQQEIAELKKQLLQAKTILERQQVETKIVQNEQGFTATQWLDKGFDYKINKKDNDNAIFAFSKAIELNPQYADAYYNRGTVYYYNGQYDLAIIDFNKAIQLNPHDVDAYNNRGIVYEQHKGQYDLAITDYSKAIQLNPQYTEAYKNRGIAYCYKGQYDLAIIDYSKAIQLNPHDADAYNKRGIAYWGKFQYDLAIIDFNKAIQLNPQYAETYFTLGFLSEKFGRNTEAIQAYKLFLQYTPSTDTQHIEAAKQRIRELSETT